MTTQPSFRELDLSWTFGDRIRKIRRAAGMSQADMGHLAGVSAQSVATWETRGSSPRNVVAIAKRLELATGIDAAWILGLQQRTPHRREGAGSVERWALRGSNPEPMVSGSALVGAGAGRLAGAGWAA